MGGGCGWLGRVAAAASIAATLGGCGASLAASSSGQIGCPEEAITTEETSTGLYGAETWTATCNGRKFYCSYTRTGVVLGHNMYGQSGQVNCTPEMNAAGDVAPPATADPPKALPPPTGAAGFSFGATVADAERACTQAGKQWTAETASCSGTPTDVGFSAEARLGLCDDRVCAIELHARPKDVVQAYGALKETLVRKYGDPKSVERDVPGRCTASVLSECLSDGRAKLTHKWRWMTGETVALSIGPGDDAAQTVTVRLRYAKPATGLQPKADGL